MIDLKVLRENPEKVKKAVSSKQVKIDIDEVLNFDEKKRTLTQKIEKLRAEQNKVSKTIQKSTRKKELIKKMKDLKKKLIKLEKEEKNISEKLSALLVLIPNIPLANVPLGKNEKNNIVLRKVPASLPPFDFPPLDYIKLAEKLDLIDTKRAGKVSGTRFGYIKNELVFLEFALVRFALETLSKEGFIPVIPPVMIKKEPFMAMGYGDRGEEEVYKVSPDDLYLVGTSEQSLGPYHMKEILSYKDLPRRYVAFSTCFRREAGSYGRDTQGILRVHQFDKVEMFSFCHPDESQEEHKFLLNLEEKLMQALEIPYQVVQMCTGDLGDPAAAKFDIEAWMPGQGQYRETHSTSNCTDFQARRLQARFRNKEGKVKLLHTLNGTAFAIGRTLIAIIENYQQKDGSILVPKVLRPLVPFEKISR